MITLGIDLGVGEAGAGGDDASERALDQFARLRRLNLIDNCNFDALIEKLLNVGLGSVERNASHRHAVAVGQCDAEQLRAALGIL